MLCPSHQSRIHRKNPLEREKTIPQKKLRQYDKVDAEKQADEAIEWKKTGKIQTYADYFRNRAKDDVPESTVRRYHTILHIYLLAFTQI